MSDLIAIIYPSEQKAEEVRQRLFKLQKEYLITISDAVIAVKTDAGPVKLNQLVNTTAVGAVSGSFWGLLIGVLFLNPILGVALGAASGALGGALSDYGIDDAFMKELSASMQPGNAALFVLVKNMTPDKVLREIQDAGGTVLKTSLDDSKEQQLREALAKRAQRRQRPKRTPPERSNRSPPAIRNRMLVDPRHGDIEDDAASPGQRSLLAIAGSLLVEISLPKLLLAWTVLLLFRRCCWVLRRCSLPPGFQPCRNSLAALTEIGAALRLGHDRRGGMDRMAAAVSDRRSQFLVA